MSCSLPRELGSIAVYTREVGRKFSLPLLLVLGTAVLVFELLINSIDLNTPNLSLLKYPTFPWQETPLNRCDRPLPRTEFGYLLTVFCDTERTPSPSSHPGDAICSNQIALYMRFYSMAPGTRLVYTQRRCRVSMGCDTFA